MNEEKARIKAEQDAEKQHQKQLDDEEKARKKAIAEKEKARIKAEQDAEKQRQKQLDDEEKARKKAIAEKEKRLANEEKARIKAEQAAEKQRQKQLDDEEKARKKAIAEEERARRKAVLLKKYQDRKEQILHLVQTPRKKIIAVGIAGVIAGSSLNSLSTNDIVEIYAKTQACVGYNDSSSKIYYCACKVKHDIHGLLSATDDEKESCRKEARNQ